VKGVLTSQQSKTGRVTVIIVVSPHTKPLARLLVRLPAQTWEKVPSRLLAIGTVGAGQRLVHGAPHPQVRPAIAVVSTQAHGPVHSRATTCHLVRGHLGEATVAVIAVEQSLAGPVWAFATKRSMNRLGRSPPSLHPQMVPVADAAAAWNSLTGEAPAPLFR